MITPWMLSELRKAERLLSRLGRDRWGGERLVEPGPEVPVDKQIHAQQRHEIRQRPAEAGLQLQIREEQQGNQRGPDLGVQGVGRRTEVNDRRIQAEQLVLEAKLVARGDRLTARQRVIKDRLIQPPGVMGVGIRQRRPAGAR